MLQYSFKKTFATLVLATALLTVVAQEPKKDTPVDPAELAKIRAAIETNPDDLASHEAYLKASGFSKWGVPIDPEFVKQYEAWMNKFPKSAAVPYALGHAFASKESPKAKDYLLKAVQIDPKFAKAYYDLWIDGERWGDFKTSREFLRKAKESDPKSPDYAFYYANSFSNSDPKKYEELSTRVAREFKDSERGAQSLYWLANRTNDRKKKMMFYELQRSQFPPDKFNWSSSGMSEYFDLLLVSDPAKAEELANYMTALKPRDLKGWETKQVLAKNMGEAKNLMAAGKYKEAVELLEKVTVSKWSQSRQEIAFLKAKALDQTGKTAEAYQSLLTYYAKEPDPKMEKEILGYGKKLNITETVVKSEAWYIRDTSAKTASSFALKRYMDEGTSTLEGYRGKVVLLTYWFPGCGPCRGEFPHFENVVRKFKGKDLVYLGINIVEDQDEYVVPFMKSSGYSFIPLHDDSTWKKGTLDNRNAAPVNFLIDGNGKIIFANFRTNERNEDALELMIQSMLDRNKSGQSVAGKAF